MIQHTVYFVIGRILKQILTLLTSVAVARYLGPNELGLMSYILSYGAILVVLSNAGLTPIILRECSKKETDNAHILGAAFKIRFFTALFSSGLFFTITCIDPKMMGDLKYIAWVYCISFFFRSFECISTSYQAELKGQVVAYSEIIQSFISLGLKLTLIIFKLDLFWFVLVSALEWAIIILGLIYFGKGLPRISFDSNTQHYSRVLVKNAFPYLFSGMSVIIYHRIDQIMINHMVGSSDVGFYAISVRLTEIVTLIPTLIATALFPLLVKNKERKKSNENVIQKYFDLVIWSGIPMTLLLFLSARWLIPFLYGIDYIMATSLLQILLIKGVIKGIDSTYSKWILLQNYHSYVYLRQGLGCVLNIILNIWLIPKMGSQGACWATIITMIVVILFSALLSELRLCMHFQIKSLLGGVPRICGYSIQRINRWLG